ncbi:MAG: hypothetical protein AAGA56_04925 [Myxococcota bacterium]
MREAAYPWHLGGEITVEGAERAWYLRDLAARLGDKLGFDGFSRFELTAADRTTIGIEAPMGFQLVLSLESHLDPTPLLRTLGVQ